MISSGILISRRIFYYLFKSFNVIFQCVKYTSPVRDHICFCQETQSIAAHQTHTQSCQFSTVSLIAAMGSDLQTMCFQCTYAVRRSDVSQTVHAPYIIDCRDGIGLGSHVLSMYVSCAIAKEWCIRNCAHAVIHGHTTQLRCVAVYYEMRVWLLAVPVFSCLEFSFLVVTGRNCYVFLCLGVNRISSL